MWKATILHRQVEGREEGMIEGDPRIQKKPWWFPFSMDREVLGLLDHGENSLDFGLFIIKSHFF